MASASTSGGPAASRGSSSIVYIVLATILFSSMEIALKSVVGRFNALQMNFLRFLIGGLFLLPFALGSLKRRRAGLRPGDWGFFALSGFACVVLSMTLYQLAIQYCKASIVAVLFSCNPAFVIPLAAVFLKERIRGFTVASLGASVIGMACIMNPFGGGTAGGGEIGAGIALTIASAAIFAVYSVMGKARGGRVGGLASTAFSFILGSFELLVLIGLGHLPPLARALRGSGLGGFAEIPLVAGLDLGVLPVFAYICLCVTGIGYAAYFMAIETSSATTASLVFCIKPALAPVLALAILGESIAPTTVLGIVLIALGSSISFAGASRAKRKAPPAL
jgi:drug/metabolite transporter (DMT)-like permease